MEKVATNMIEKAREKWWLILLVAVIAILLLIPAQTGLPGSSYKGCDNDDPKFVSYCQYGEVKSITQESNGTVKLTIPVKFSDGTSDKTFTLSKNHGKFSIGSRVLVNYAPWDNRIYLFVNSDSNLLMYLVLSSGIASVGSTAIIDTVTMKEIEK